MPKIANKYALTIFMLCGFVVMLGLLGLVFQTVIANGLLASSVDVRLKAIEGSRFTDSDARAYFTELCQKNRLNCIDELSKP